MPNMDFSFLQLIGAIFLIGMIVFFYRAFDFKYFEYAKGIFYVINSYNHIGGYVLFFFQIQRFLKQLLSPEKI